MKLLVVTQAVDLDDPVLGFFHRWIEEFAKHCEAITVVCLYEGRHVLPKNVKVYSLGKEKGEASRFVYVTRFLGLSWRLRNGYDAVFVHMNQEYVLLGGLLWKLLGKRVYLWRNHYEGSWLTALAVSLCDKVFCTSKHSYTARFGKTVLMPVGIDTSVFKRDESVVRQPRSILFLARMSPSKKPDVLIEALGTMKRGRIAFKASLYGDAPAHDSTYYDGLKERVRELGISAETTFHTGIPNTQTPAIYQAHDIFVNLSRAGMFDKTIGEAMACDCLVATSNDAVKSVVGDAFISKPSSEHVAGVLARLLALSPSERERRSRTAAEFIEYEHSLSLLAQRLFGILGS